jgi:hypothetical protein
MEYFLRQGAIFDARFGVLGLHPRKRRFKTGVSAILKKHAHEERIIAEALPFVLNGLADINNEAQVKKVQTLIDACVTYNVWRGWLAYKDHTTETLKKLTSLGKLLMTRLEEVEKVTGAKDFGQSIKVHHIVHWPEHIRRFGCTSNYNTETFESAHKLFVKSVAGVVCQRWKHGGILSMLRRECRKRALGLSFVSTRALNHRERNLREESAVVENMSEYLFVHYDLDPNEMWDGYETKPSHWGAAWCVNEKCWIRPGHALQWVSLFICFTNT